MNVCVFYYDGFCESEVVLSLWGGKVHRQHNIFSAAMENRVYISEENQKFLPDKTIEELNSDDVDLFIIPGGDPSNLFDSTALENFIKELNKKDKYIAGICGGTHLMAKFEVLNNRKCTGNGSGITPDFQDIHLFNKTKIVDEDVVVDDNVITATGQSFVEFAMELKKIMKVFDNDKEEEEEYMWLKNKKIK